MHKDEIKIDKLTLLLNKKIIISNLELNLIKSEIHAVIGLSGAGKTQLLRTINNLNAPETPSSVKQKMRIVFQENNLIPWLSLWQNVKIVSNKNDEEILILFKKVGLEDSKFLKPEQISSGMQQRLSLIRAISSDCELLLLDEPFSKLDVVNKKINHEILMNLWAEKKPTILLVTHDIDEAILLSDRISFFSKFEKKITHTEVVNFKRPRAHDELLKLEIYQNLHNRFLQLLTEDYHNVQR